VRALLIKVDGQTVRIGDREWTLETTTSDVILAQPTWRDEFLTFITNPNIAYLLLLIGIYGLIFEFSNPGLVLPGVTGAVALILGLYALHLLPVNYAGLGLILLGLALITAEAFAPSFGILGISGVVAFVFGSVLLLDTDIPGFRVSPYLIGTIAMVTSALALLFMTLAVRAMRRPVVSGAEGMLGLKGQVLDWKGHEGHVRTHGEIWAARSTTPLTAGDNVLVRGLDGLVLEVDRLPEKGETS
jgi:membrane-bound serine protease (ClpP class)